MWIHLVYIHVVLVDLALVLNGAVVTLAMEEGLRDGRLDGVEWW
jgi:hypothetical protein